MYKECKSLAELANNYDAYILDIWGVIHDGEEAYPGVLNTMKQLRAAGKKIIFLSNAPRRAFKVKEVLAKFGITEDLYDGAISSGEAAYDILSANSQEQTANYLYIGPPKDFDLLDGLPYTAVKNASDAKFTLATGFDDDYSTLEEKLPQIKDALANNLKMYCVNPDLLVVRQNGTKMLCAGVIGEYYASQSGQVEFIGKPHPLIYNLIFDKYLTGIPKNRIVAVGDNLDTDILGANKVGIDSILTLGGVLKGETAPLAALMTKAGAKPTATIPQFNW